MSSFYDNKVVWITGASSGIGEAIVFAAAKSGAKLVLSARREEVLRDVKIKAGLQDADVLLLPLDLEMIKDFDALAAKVYERFGRIDVLINNAGISQRGLAKLTPVSVDERLMQVNYVGTVALTKAVLPYMLKQKSGNITTVTSAVGKFGSPWRSGYAATKHALHGFFDSLRAELYEDGIQVLLVCPGFVHTNVSKNALNELGEATNQMDQATQQGLSPKFVAERILHAIATNKEEILIGGFKEKLGAWVKRFFPSLFSVMVRKMAVR